MPLPSFAVWPSSPGPPPPCPVQPDEAALRARELTFRRFQALLHRPEGAEEAPTPRPDPRQAEGNPLDGAGGGEGDAVRACTAVWQQLCCGVTCSFGCWTCWTA